MKIGFIGLGKMGIGMVRRLIENGHEVVAWNRSPEPLSEIAKEGVVTSQTLEDLVSKLPAPRFVWVMVSAGSAVDELITKLSESLVKGDTIIDGGNSFYKDSLRRSKLLLEKGIEFMDVGVSGGPYGARNGACLMIGGKRDNFLKLEELFKTLSAPNAYKYLGKAGAGHFAKMVHNGIEYGMMQSIAEGAAILKTSEFNFDLSSVFEIYNNKSVIESRLVGWIKEAFDDDKNLSDISSKIDHTGEGEWTVKAAKEMGIEVPILEGSFNVRVNSEKDNPSSPSGFRNKVVSAIRGKFGHHKVKIQ